MSHMDCAAHLCGPAEAGFGLDCIRLRGEWSMGDGGGYGGERISRCNGEKSIFGPARPVGTDAEEGMAKGLAGRSAREEKEGDRYGRRLA